MYQATIVIALLAVVQTASAVAEPPATTILVGCDNEFRPAARLELPPGPTDRPVVYNEFWPELDRMSPEERSNSEIWLEPLPGTGSDARAEALAISSLWNRGDYDAAVERARGYSRLGNPGEVAVVVTHKNPLELEPVPGFGPDIRIGAQESLFGCALDRADNGWLFASFPALDSNRTVIYSYRSTNSGSTWTELQYIYWNASNVIKAANAVCHGNYLVVGVVLRGSSANRCYTARLSMTTGNFVRYPGDSLLVTGFEAASGDSIEELAFTSTEDSMPGFRVYLFGRTTSGVLEFAWTDSSCRAWRNPSTSVTTCHNGLDCAYNDAGDTKLLWCSWLYYGAGDTARLAFGYRTTEDTLFHKSYFTNAYSQQLSRELTTSITLYHDTIQIGFLGRGLIDVRHVYRFDCDSGSWYQSVFTDTLQTRDVVEVTGRRGGGFGVAWRNYSSVQGRHVMFRHANRVQGTYSAADTVSENRPHSQTRIRVERLAGSEYGLAWVSWHDAPYGAAFFDRITPAGIAEREPPALPVPLSLTALPRRGAVRLGFENPAEGLARIRLFDLSGRLVLAHEQRFGTGRCEVVLSPPVEGVLFAVVDAGGHRAGTKFSFVR